MDSPTGNLSASEAAHTHLKTQSRYKQSYEVFTKWQESNGITSFDENVLLKYFVEASKSYKFSTLMSMYSMLKNTLSRNNNVDLSSYKELLAFLKEKSVGFEKKKFKVFTDEEVNRFLAEAPDEHYLAMKAILVFGVSGECKVEELADIKNEYVKDYGTEVIVRIPVTENHRAKVFVIGGEFAKIVQRYMQQRPAKATADSFFLQYHQGECQYQTISKQKLAIVPKDIAKFLKLPDYKSYSGHSYKATTSRSGKRRHNTVLHVMESQAPKRLDVRDLPTKTNSNPKKTMPQSQKAARDVPSVSNIFHEKKSFEKRQQQVEKSLEPIMPMLPLTTALMKRKSKYYMGLEPDRFLRLLQLANQRKTVSDVKLMLALRRLRLNEDFEVLGDLFDLDKTTAEQYYHETKHEAIDLVDLLATTTSVTTQFQVFSEPIIKIEACDPSYISDPLAINKSASAFNPSPRGVNWNSPKNAVKLNSAVAVEPVKTHNYGSKTVEPITTEDNDSTHSTTQMNVDDQDDLDMILDDFEFSLPDDRGFLSDEIRKRTAQCTVCHKFYPPRLLNSHMDSVHHLNIQNLNRTICGLCWKEYDTEKLLKTHQKDVHGGGCYGCDVCGKLFSTKRYMGVHILTKHAQVKTYLCDSCGEGFPVESSLKAHVIRKHMERGFDCHLCDMKFIAAKALKDHICARHTNARPYQCEFNGCGKTFSWPSAFRSHKRVHAEDKYECSICLQQFSFKYNLQNHMKNIHNEILFNKKCLSSKFI